MQQSWQAWSVLVSLVVVWNSFARADDVIPVEPPLRWWKGNTHTHTFWSDGNDFPEMVAEWYRVHDYNFLALSDHNTLSEGPKWLSRDELMKRGGEQVIEKYQARFGGGWVETRDNPEPQLRLKPLAEFRALVEQRGRFLMIQGEEISDKVDAKPVHLNATNIQEAIQPIGGRTVSEAIANNLRAVEQQAERKGTEIFVHLNHPNYQLAITAEELAEVVSERFFEVYNGHPGVKHLGEGSHPPVERLWDIANTIRIAYLQAAPLFGVATDDSHEYHGKAGSHPGRGWIMVRARYLTPEHIVRAIKAGDCYASSGVILDEVLFDSKSRELRLAIANRDGVSFKTQFIGTPATGNAKATKTNANKVRDLPEVGKVFAEVEGLTPSYRLSGDELYVRAVVTSSREHSDPSFENQHEQAWTQPVGWK